MTTAGGPEYIPPRTPAQHAAAEAEQQASRSLGDQVARLAARVMNRTPARQRAALADSIVTTREPGPDDTTLMQVTPARPETLADVEAAERTTPAVGSLAIWQQYLDAVVDGLNRQRPDPHPAQVLGAFSALELAVEALDHAGRLCAPYIAEAGTITAARSDQLAAVLDALGAVHVRVAVVTGQLMRQLGTVHRASIDGTITAPPGADPMAEVEAVMRDVIALTNHADESTARTTSAVKRLSRISWSGE